MTLPSPRSTVRAFSLTELLIGIGIIAALLALLSPVINSAVRSSRDAKCLSNLRQIGQANIAFAADHHGLIAAGGTWEDYWWQMQIRPYLGGDASLDNFIPALACPADPNQGWGDPPTLYPVARRSYGVNDYLRDRKLIEIATPSRMVYAGDTGLGPHDSSWTNGQPHWLNALPRKRHAGRSNYVFLDGHVDSFPIPSLYPGGENNAIFTQ